MDRDALDTFLCLAQVKRLSRCADRLCLTKSAVSARIKQLEQQLGVSLFERSHQGMVLSEAGERFLPHASALQQRWQLASQAVAEPSQEQPVLRLGAHPSIAQTLLDGWQSQLRKHYPQQAIALSVDYSELLVQQLSAQQLDIALVFVADSTAGIKVEQVYEDRLIMVSSHAQKLEQVDPARYLYVDWGWGYTAAHAQLLPQLERYKHYCGFAPLALPGLLDCGGSGYLPARQAQHPLESGQLVAVADAPVFHRPIFAISPRQQSHPLTQAALQQLRQFLEGL